MCVQCMAGAMTACAGAAGAKSYLQAKRFSWVTPRRMRAITAGLCAVALLGSSTLGGSSAPTRAAANPAGVQHAAQR